MVDYERGLGDLGFRGTKGGGYPAAGQSDPAGSGAVYSGNGSGGV